MDFQWFDSVSWDSIKDLRGTTYVQPPPGFKFALQQAQHAILRAIMHNNPSSLAPEPTWKALVLSCWLLSGRLAEHASESNCALTTWRPGLISSGLKIGQRSGPWYVLNVMFHLCRLLHAEQPQNRNSHGFARLPLLLERVRKGRALAAARNAPAVSVTEQMVQEI